MPRQAGSCRSCRTLAAMRTVEQAREAAVAQLAATGLDEADAMLIDSKTEQFEAGWMFHYQSPGYIERATSRKCWWATRRSLFLATASLLSS